MEQPQHIKLWEEFLAIIADNVETEQYNAWFKPITSVSFVDGTLTIQVPTQFFMEQIEVRFRQLMSAALTRVYGVGTKLFYRYNLEPGNPDGGVNFRYTNPSPAVKSPSPQHPANTPTTPDTQLPDFEPCLLPELTFENYCKSECNQLARSIGEAIADDIKRTTFNPFFIFGPSGCGKTHLLQAIGIRVKEHDAHARVLYVTAREFESQFIKYRKDIAEFMFFYQSLDMLIVDDIQDLMGKPGTQRAFFHIFNHLVQNGKKLIMSSDCRPSQMEGMEERLLSRFKQGMTAELERPDAELRRSVLRLKAEQAGIELSDEIVDYVVANVTQSIRELEGVVITLVARAMVMNCDIDMTLARTVVGNAVNINRPQLNFEMIAEVVASYYGIDPEMIYTSTRRREISDPRQLVMYLAKKHTKMPLKTIGLKLNRNHATVIYAIRQTEERMPTDRKLAADVKAIEAQLLKA